MAAQKTQKRDSSNGAFRDVPYMGVIWVVAEAMKLGYYNGNPEWANLGQGQPEIGEIEGAPQRIISFDIEPRDQAYGPLGGSQELREKIAEHYNRLFRKKHSSKYTAENVSIAMGGRLVLTRIFASLDKIRLGYKTPDYTAYEDMINYQKGHVTPVQIPTSRKNAFDIPANEFERTIKKYKLDAYLISNPCNPTGNVIEGDDLKTYVQAASKNNCTLILDEFYSQFIFEKGKPGKRPVSAAEYVDDVNKAPVILIDGLTKSFRYPGWRIGWAVGPKNMIDILNRAASAIDGGPSQPMTRAAIKVLQENYAAKETTALRKVFSRKRNIMIEALTKSGIECLPQVKGTFYIWGNISNLPKPINTAERFFFEALKHRVMTVPGYFFDIQPGKKKKAKSDFDGWVRFSFGPPEYNIIAGLDRLTTMIKSFSKKKF